MSIELLTKWPEVGDAAPAPAPGKLPILALPGNGVEIIECARELFSAIAPSKTLFNRGDSPMRLWPDKETGIPRLEILSPEVFASTMERFFKLVAYRSGRDSAIVMKPTTCPREKAVILLAADERRQLLPTIRGLAGCAILREIDGELHVAGNGYDEKTGIFVTGQSPMPMDVPLEQAVDSLKRLLVDFDFQSPGDEARAIAAFIAPAMKLGRFIPTFVPCEVAEADKSQAGKGLRTSMIAAIYGEEVAMVTQKDGGVGSTDETFSARLVEGRPFVCLENWRGKLGSTHLEAFLTARAPFPCRLPCSPEVLVRADGFFLSLTSNGVELTEDFANRCSFVRIRKRPADYTFQRYQEGGVLQHIVANQPHYLGSVHAIIREWVRLGKPMAGDRRHDFVDWYQRMDWIVRHIMRCAPLMEGHIEVQGRVSNPRLVWLRSLLLEADRVGVLGRPHCASELFRMCLEANPDPLTPPGMTRDDTDEERGGKAIGSILKRLLTDDTQRVDDHQITRIISVKPRPDGRGTYDAKEYVITRV